MYSENGKKSIYFRNRNDIFILICVFIVVITPIIAGGISRLKAKNIYISARCEDFFGGKTMEKLTREFREQNSDFRITLLSASGEKGREPDILFFDDDEFNGLAPGGTLLPLDSFLEDETGVRTMAVPLVSFMDLLFYNIGLLQAAGFERPPKTRDEFLEYAQTISLAGGLLLEDAIGAGMALSPPDKLSMPRDVFSWIWAAGGDFWSDQDSAPVINTRQVINDFNFFDKFYREETLAGGYFDMTGEQALEGFAQGRIAMLIASSRNIPALREKMGDDVFGITTIPVAGTAGKYNICLTGIFAGINKNCANPGAAWIFLEFLASQSPLLCAQLKAVPGYVPELISGDNKNYIKEDPFYAKAWDIFESSVVVRGFLGVPGAQEYETAFREELKVFLKSDRSARETVTAIRRRWDEVFKSFVPQN